jgi:putative thioredoxin
MTIDVRNFETEVIQQSRDIPVLVDFWAAWCGPCKILTPILERLAAKSNDSWLLAKVDTDEHSEATMKFGVHGIPNVKLFIDGKVIAEFVGALPEHSVAQWLKKNIPNRNQARIDEAITLLDKGNAQTAQPLLESLYDEDPSNQQVKAFLAKTYLYNNPERAAELVKDIDDPKLSETTDTIRTLLHLREVSRRPETLAEGGVKQQYLDAIDDVVARRFDPALEKFIQIIRIDRNYDDDGSRKACIAIFKYLGENHPSTLAHRRDFGSALYV